MLSQLAWQAAGRVVRAAAAGPGGGGLAKGGIRAANTARPAPPCFSAWAGLAARQATARTTPTRPRPPTSSFSAWAGLAVRQTPTARRTKPPFPSAAFASWARQAGMQSYQRRGDLDPQTALYGLMGLNVAVFGAWQVSNTRRDLRSFLAKHAIVSPGAIADGRVWTLVTSAFSHRDFSHLLVNMITLYFFGGSVARTYGGRRLVGLYLAAGAAGSAAHSAAGAIQCARRHPAGGRPRAACIALSPGALGASGAVNGVLALSILANPRATVLVYGILPVPAFILGGLYVLQDLRGVSGGGGGGHGRGVAHWGHLGGMAVGVALWVLRVRRGKW